MNRIDLEVHAAQLAATNGRSMMAPVIKKELLHYEILSTLEKEGLLSGIIFQGGTCLRLCYGASRYSEDLDFVGGKEFDLSSMHEVKSCLEKALPKQYLVSATVKEPTDVSSLVKKWRITVDTALKSPDVPSQKISLEIASVPAYTKQAHMLRLNYEGLPASYEDTILNTESLEEILADKLESFVCSSHIRYRDLWDLHWLSRRPRINIEEAHKLRELKESDYNEAEKFRTGLVRVKKQLGEIVEGEEFRKQMMRFLPSDLFEKTIGSDSFRGILADTVLELYERY